MSSNVVAIVSVEINDYRIHFCYMNKDKAIVVLNNTYLKENGGSL